MGSPALVISICCPKETAKQGYLSRKLPDRLDDDAQMFEKRFDEFDVNNPAIVDYYRAAGTLEEVFETTYAQGSVLLMENNYSID